MAVRNIFFDLGGVLFNLNTRLSLQRFAALGMDIPQEILLDAAPFNASACGPFICQLIHKVDLGEVNGQEFIEAVRSHCRPDTTDAQVLAAYNDVVEVPLRSLQLLEDLSTEYRLFAVSNIGDLHWERVCLLAEEQGYDLRGLFTQCFLSYEMHLTKPSREYFEAVVRLSQVDPAETLYIDDSKQNVEAGRSVGLQAQLVKPFDLSCLPTYCKTFSTSRST